MTPPACPGAPGNVSHMQRAGRDFTPSPLLGPAAHPTVRTLLGPAAQLRRRGPTGSPRSLLKTRQESHKWNSQNLLNHTL